jgi:tripartite-type tricarboxylate transporter receptor subunit TctC
MSDDLRTRISRAIADVVRDEKLATKLRAIAAAPVTKDAATFAPFYLAEVARWKKFSQETNIKFGD